MINKNDLLVLFDLKPNIKKQIENINDLNEVSLFDLIYENMNTINNKMKCCTYFINNSSNKEVITKSKTNYNLLLNKIDVLKSKDKNTIYEIQINQKGINPSSYLANSYNDALNKLKSIFLCNYKDDINENEDIDMVIIKRKIYKISNPKWIDDIIYKIYFDKNFNPTFINI